MTNVWLLCEEKQAAEIRMLCQSKEQSGNLDPFKLLRCRRIAQKCQHEMYRVLSVGGGRCGCCRRLHVKSPAAATARRRNSQPRRLRHRLRHTPRTRTRRQQQTTRHLKKKHRPVVDHSSLDLTQGTRPNILFF